MSDTQVCTSCNARYGASWGHQGGLCARCEMGHTPAWMEKRIKQLEREVKDLKTELYGPTHIGEGI